MAAATETRFKWINRKKATEDAIALKKEQGITSEEAVTQILADNEGTYFTNGSEISEQRRKNFIQRVEEGKPQMTRTSRTAGKTSALSHKEIDHEFNNMRIRTLYDRGDVTEIQAKILDCVFTSLKDMPFGESNLKTGDVPEMCGLSANQARGAIGHLVRKGFIFTAEGDLEGERGNYVYISEAHMELYNDKELQDIVEQVSSENVDAVETTEETTTTNN